MEVSLGANRPGREAEVAQTLGRSFLLQRAAAYLLLPEATGIALLPVAAALSPEETHSKMNLPEGILRLERAAKWLLEEEKAISKIYLVGEERFGYCKKMR